MRTLFFLLKIICNHLRPKDHQLIPSNQWLVSRRRLLRGKLKVLKMARSAQVTECVMDPTVMITKVLTKGATRKIDFRKGRLRVQGGRDEAVTQTANDHVPGHHKEEIETIRIVEEDLSIQRGIEAIMGMKIQKMQTKFMIERTGEGIEIERGGTKEVLDEMIGDMMIAMEVMTTMEQMVVAITEKDAIEVVERNDRAVLRSNFHL